MATHYELTGNQDPEPSFGVPGETSQADNLEPQIVTIDCKTYKWLSGTVSQFEQQVQGENRFWDRYAVAIRSQWLQAVADFVDNKSTFTQLADASVAYAYCRAEEVTNEDRDIAQYRADSISNILKTARGSAAFASRHIEKLDQARFINDFLLSEVRLPKDIKTFEQHQLPGQQIIKFVVSSLESLGSYRRVYSHGESVTEELSPTPSCPLSYQQSNILANSVRVRANSMRRAAGLG